MKDVRFMIFRSFNISTLLWKTPFPVWSLPCQNLQITIEMMTVCELFQIHVLRDETRRRSSTYSHVMSNYEIEILVSCSLIFIFLWIPIVPTFFQARPRVTDPVLPSHMRRLNRHDFLVGFCLSTAVFLPALKRLMAKVHALMQFSGPYSSGWDALSIFTIFSQNGRS
jgi:hypothetical protein